MNHMEQTRLFPNSMPVVNNKPFCMTWANQIPEYILQWHMLWSIRLLSLREVAWSS